MKILQIALGNQFDIRDALATMGDVIYWDWSGQHQFSFNLNCIKIFKEHKPELVFMQIQSPNVIHENTLLEMSKKATVINWTGDVRAPLPLWYKMAGKYCITLFTNMNDVEQMQSLGHRSDYLQIGVPNKIFHPGVKPIQGGEILFMGNNNGQFPLSSYRSNLVNFLKNRFPNQFKVYGSGWRDSEYITDQNKEAQIYRGAKMAINLSHFCYKRYTSDRMLRIMGSGCFCLTHRYPGIEQEFEDGKHLVIWEDQADLINKINYYLAHDEERIAIAKEGCDHIHKNHTWQSRIPELKRILNDYK